MGPPVDAVSCSESLPHSTEVLIIGGGIIGVSAALTLAERGIPVVLCEKGEIGAEQSSRNWGWCRQQGRDRSRHRLRRDRGPYFPTNAGSHRGADLQPLR